MINERLIDTEVAAGGGGSTEAEQGLILHLDANDVDSYDGDGSEWIDVSTFEKTIPLSDNADDLELHLNASDSTSYGGSGTTWTDISGNSRNATIGGGFESTFDKDNGGFFHLDGSDADEATVSHNTSLDITSSGFTVEACVNPDDTNYNTLVAKFSTSASVDGYALRFNVGDIYWALYTSGSLVGTCNYTTGSEATANTWHHIVGTITGTATGSTMKLYKNGELLTTSTTTGTYTPTTRDVRIGGYDYANARNFDGKIGAVRIYSKALSPSEVGQNYRHGRDYIYTDLIPNTDLALHFDAADLTSAANTTWTDKAASLALTKSGTVGYDDELGDFIDFGGGYYANDSYTDNFEDSSGNTTVEFWYNPDSLTTQNAIIQFRNGAGSRWHIGILNSTFLSYYYGTSGTGGGEVSTSTLGISNGEWYHFSVVKTPTSMKYYIDGELKETDTFSNVGSGAQSITGIRIGDVHYVGGYGSDGQLGQLRIYKAGLTQDQIRQNYNFTKNNYPNGNDGTISGATWNSGGYFDFDGTNDYVTIPHSNNLNMSNYFSVEAWVNRDDDGDGYIFDKQTNTSTQYGWFLNFGNGFFEGYQFKLWSTTNAAYIAKSYISNSGTAGDWQHVVGTFDGANAKIYVDGDLKGTSSAFSGTASTNTQQVVLGTSINTSPQFLDGKISKTRIYNKALTQAEIDVLYSEGE